MKAHRTAETNGKVLILGSRGRLGGQLRRIFQDPLVWDRPEVDLTELQNLQKKCDELVPGQVSAIINCVAYNDVENAERQPELAIKLNADAVRKLAEIASALDVPLVHFSTGHVFNGEDREYPENARPEPLSAYGRSKAQGEKYLQEITDKFYIVRTNVLFGPKGEGASSKKSFVELILELSGASRTLRAIYDEVNSITYVPDLAQSVYHMLLQHKPYGIYHATNEWSVSWYDFAYETLLAAGYEIRDDPSTAETAPEKQITLIPVGREDFPRAARRPRRIVLKNTKLTLLQGWQDALKEHFLNEFKWQYTPRIKPARGVDDPYRGDVTLGRGEIR
jgi:dTDP-4-dehydrorhamnose reductase